jgi:hypothetical protein
VLKLAKFTVVISFGGNPDLPIVTGDENFWSDVPKLGSGHN